MTPKDARKEQIKYTLKGTDFQGLGEKYKGKVRDVDIS